MVEAAFRTLKKTTGEIGEGDTGDRLHKNAATGSAYENPDGEPDKHARAGYSLEKDRRQEYAIRENQVEPGRPAVRPSIWIATAGACLLLLLAVVVSPRECDTQAALAALREYQDYSRAKPNAELPTADQLRSQLIELQRMRDLGRTTEAKNAWQNLLVLVRGDIQNPIYKFCLKCPVRVD